MMQRVLLVAAILLGLASTGCAGQSVTVKVEQTYSSSIKIVTTDDDPVTVSAPGAKGAINMHVNDQLHYKILRTVVKYTGLTTTTDVTAKADFNFTNPPVAAMDLTGQLTAFVPGFTTLEVVYRDSAADPFNNDKVALEITVTP